MESVALFDRVVVFTDGGAKVFIASMTDFLDYIITSPLLLIENGADEDGCMNAFPIRDISQMLVAVKSKNIKCPISKFCCLYTSI